MSKTLPKMHSARTRLDARQPLVLDTRDLGRRPGSMRRVQRTVSAPADLGTALAIIAPGSDLVLDLRLEAVMEGVLVSGTVGATMTGECGRCLDPVSSRFTVDIQELFAYPESGDRGSSSRKAAPAPVADDEDGLPLLIDDLIDLEPVLRDALVLELPMSPLCSEECRGLCPACGEKIAELPENHSHDAVDPRWAALAGFRSQAEPAESSPEQES
jgi:uncharacterized protein